MSSVMNPSRAATEIAAGAPIQIRSLVKKFGELVAVDQVSLSVRAGRLFGFLGPNGAGKSTTIGCLTGLLDPTAGEVWLLGEKFDSNAIALKRRMGVMPEGLALFDQLYAQEFLAFQGRMFGLPEATVRERVEELLEVFELTDTHKRRLADFSTGMRKKVAFAAAVIHSPEILFLDEPFESMDPSTVAMVKGWLRNYARQGKTVFMTSHVLETVEKLCDEVAIIKDGRLVWVGGIEADDFGKPTFACNGRQFESLEDLFLEIVGRHDKKLDWF